MKRAHIPGTAKLAATLACLLPQEQRDALRRLKPPAASVLSMFDFDHIVLHAHGGSDEWWNLDPKLRAEHKEKSRRDTSIVAKTKRIQQANAQHVARMAALGKAVANQVVRDYVTLREVRAKRRWPSRSFPKGRKIRHPTPHKEK